jgi:hypothetical protein
MLLTESCLNFDIHDSDSTPSFAFLMPLLDLGLLNLELGIGRGVRGVVWFGFEAKSQPNRKIKKHAAWFGSVDF